MYLFLPSSLPLLPSLPLPSPSLPLSLSLPPHSLLSHLSLPLPPSLSPSQDTMLLVQYRQECPMLVKCLLVHCKSHRDDVHTLFQLLRVYMTRHISSFYFLTSYLENEVAKEYSIAEKRAIFFHFVEVFNSTSYPQDLKAKVRTIALKS